MQSVPPAIEPESFLSGIRWSVVVRGALLDILLSALVGLPLLLHYAGVDFFAEDPAVADRAVEKAYQSWVFNVLGLALGLLCTVYAAYWAGRRVEHSHVRNGAWVAILSLAFVLPFLLVPALNTVRPPLWVDVIGVLGMLPAGMLGGYIAAHLSRPAS